MKINFKNNLLTQTHMLILFNYFVIEFGTNFVANWAKLNYKFNRNKSTIFIIKFLILLLKKDFMLKK